MSSRRVLMAVPQYVFPVVGGRSAHELGKALVQGRDAVHALSSHFYPSQDDVELVDGVCVHRVKVDRVRTEFSLDIVVSQLHRVYESLVPRP